MLLSSYIPLIRQSDESALDRGLTYQHQLPSIKKSGMINNMIQRLRPGTKTGKIMIISESLRQRSIQMSLSRGRRAGSSQLCQDLLSPTQISSEPKLFLLETKSSIFPDFNVKSITKIPLHNIWVLTFDCEGFQIELNYKVNGKLSLKQTTAPAWQLGVGRVQYRASRNISEKEANYVAVVCKLLNIPFYPK